MTKSDVIDHIDYLIAMVLGVIVFFYYWWGIDALEIFRHTEADRALIGWEMRERGDYIIPHLLGSPIFTKPPLFYWLIALVTELFNSNQVAVVRFPSLFFASAYCVFQYFFLRFSSFERQAAIIGTLIFAFGAMFYIHAAQAEMDMVFSVFCWMSLCLIFFAEGKRALPITVVSYLLAGLAFLVKGPPAIIILIFINFIYYIFRMNSSAQTRNKWWQFCKLNIAGLVIFASVVGGWLISLVSQMSWQEVIFWLDAEFYNRIFTEARYKRGALYYLPLIIEGAFPWSLALLLLAATLPFSTCRNYIKESSIWSKQRKFIVFNLISVLTITVLLSFSAGKSGRYFLPAYAFVINLCLVAALVVADSPWREKAYKLCAIVVFVLVPGLIFSVLISERAMSLFADFPLGLGLITLALVFIVICMWFPCFRNAGLVLSCVLFYLAIRYNYIYGYSEMRNQERSVLAAVRVIDSVTPKGEPIYNIELFERWISYYLKLNGRISYRLDVKRRGELLEQSGALHVLLNEEEEMWRLKVLQKNGVSYDVLAKVEDTPNPVILIRVAPEALRYWGVQERFPTVPTPPYSL